MFCLADKEAAFSNRDFAYSLQGEINVNWFTQLQAKKRYPDQVIGQATRIIDSFRTRLTFISTCG
jgi:hypothetical protein